MILPKRKFVRWKSLVDYFRLSLLILDKDSIYTDDIIREDLEGEGTVEEIEEFITRYRQEE